MRCGSCQQLLQHAGCFWLDSANHARSFAQGAHPADAALSTGECRGDPSSSQRLCHIKNVCFRRRQFVLFDSPTPPFLYPNRSFHVGTGILPSRGWHWSKFAFLNASSFADLAATARWVNGTTHVQNAGVPPYFEYHSLADTVGGAFMGREVARCAFPALDGISAVRNLFFFQQDEHAVAGRPLCSVFDTLMRSFVPGGQVLYSESLLRGNETVCLERAVFGADMWIGLWSPFYPVHGPVASRAAADMVSDFGRRLRLAFQVPEPELPWIRRWRWRKLRERFSRRSHG